MVCIRLLADLFLCAVNNNVCNANLYIELKGVYWVLYSELRDVYQLLYFEPIGVDDSIHETKRSIPDVLFGT